MQTTQLAHGKITNADSLTVELTEPPDLPSAIRIRWPQQATITTPDAYANVAASIMQILAAAVTELSAVRVWKRL